MGATSSLFTMQNMGTALQGFGSGFGAMSQLSGSKKTAVALVSAGKAQRQLADYNAEVAEMQANDALARGAEEEARHRVNVRRMVGSQRAGLAAQGVDISSGSALDIQADTAQMGELDALTIRANAAREAWGFKVQAVDLRQRGLIAEQTGYMNAEATRIAGKAGATSTLISGAGKMLAISYGWGKNDAPKYRTGGYKSSQWSDD